MQQNQHTGIVLNSKLITTMVGVIAIVTSVYYFFAAINKYENRLSKIEYSEVIRDNQLHSLTSELKTLNSRLTDLTIELREWKAANNRK